MKKLYYIVLLSILTSLTTQAQTPSQTVDRFNRNIYYGINGVYYKDIEGYFNQYIGTWQYTNGTTRLKVRFKKKYFIETDTQGSYYTDALIGEYEYIENGVTIFNTLSNLDINHTSEFDYNLFDQSRVPNYDSCYECTVPHQRLEMRYDEPTNDNSNLTGLMYIHTFTQNGQIKLYMNLYTDYNGLNTNKTNPDLPASTTELTLPNGTYIFNKVN